MEYFCERNFYADLPLFLRLIGCGPAPEELRAQEEVEKIPELPASVRTNQDFQDAFIESTLDVNKACFVYPYAEGESPTHRQNPTYRLTGHYGQSQIATLTTNCEDKHSRGQIDFKLSGIEYTAGDINHINGSVTVDNQRVRQEPLYRGYYGQSYVHFNLPAMDGFVSAFCQAETTQPRTCDIYDIEERPPIVVEEPVRRRKNNVTAGGHAD